MLCVTSENGGVRHTMDMKVAWLGYIERDAEMRERIGAGSGSVAIWLRDGVGCPNLENGGQHEPSPAGSE